MLNLKNRYPIGIDINEQNIYAAQFQNTRQGIAIRTLYHRQLNTGRITGTDMAKSLTSTLKEIAKNRGFRGKSVVIHLPAKHVYSFPVTFEIGADETIKDGIARECRRHLPFPFEEAVIDYPSLIDISSGKNKKFNAIIIAAPRIQIEYYNLLLKRAGLWPEAIDCNLSSLLRLQNHLFPSMDAPIILCNIGHKQSIITVVTKNSILALRNTPWGIKPILTSLETNLKLSEDNKHTLEILKKYGLIDERRTSSEEGVPAKENGDKNDDLEIGRSVFQILAPQVDGLIHEFYQITGYVGSEMQKIRFKEIYMYGQACIINGLDQYIKAKFDIPTKCINPVIKLALSDSSLLPDKAEGAPFALALGLALRKMTWL